MEVKYRKEGKDDQRRMSSLILGRVVHVLFPLFLQVFFFFLSCEDTLFILHEERYSNHYLYRACIHLTPPQSNLRTI